MSRAVEVREEKRDRYWVVRIDPHFDPENKRRGFQPKVTVFSDQDYSFEDHEYHWRHAYISWHSLGGTSVEEAEAFSKAITMAVEKARQMDTDHKLSTEAKTC